MLLIFAALVVVALALLVRVLTDASGHPTAVVARPIMTNAELAFFNLLRPVVAPLHVAPQVAMGALLQSAAGLSKSQGQSSRNSFSQKYVDFVLIDDAGKVKLVVELDDSTHNHKRDAGRDRMMAQAGYKTMRIRGADSRNAELLAARIAQAVLPVEAAPATRWWNEAKAGRKGGATSGAIPA